MMNDADQTSALYNSHDDDLAGRLWAFDELGADEDRPVADLGTELTSMGFILAALRRSAPLWCAIAVLGLVLGFGAYEALPPAYQASTSILLPNVLSEAPGEAVQDDAAIVQSRTVAGDALRMLGLRESAVSFIADYTATGLTNQLLVITVKATSSNAAVREANALATAFLTFQAHQLEAQERLVSTSLQQQIAAAQQHISSISRQISALSAQSASPAEHAKIGSLVTGRSQAVSALNVLKQANLNNEAAAAIQTQTLVKGSQVLDPAAPLPQHAKRYLLLYVGGGFLGGLMLGLFAVVIRALVSDRLRRRDDIAYALGSPVKLSVGKVRLSRWQRGRRGLAPTACGADVERIIAYLDHTVPSVSAGAAALALVPVDGPQVAAFALVSLAVSHAQRGLRVVVADLYPGAPAARLLEAADPGVHKVSPLDVQLVVVVPDRQDVAPAGPLGHPRRSQLDPSAEPLAAAAGQADLLLTLADLDPALGGEHLTGWTRRAVAVVTAGRSTATRIHAVGEMMRLAGIELISAVLVGADKTDESLGVTTGTGPAVPTGSGPGP